MKIEVFLRHCYSSPNQALPNRKRPPWFDKVKVYENLKRTINPELAKINIVYDEHFGSINDTFLSKEKDVEIINYGYEAGSFLRTLEIVESRGYDDDTIIYFVEDDYLHRENWCEVLIEAFSLPTHYVSLYDHLDKYIDSGYDNLESKVFFTVIGDSAEGDRIIQEIHYKTGKAVKTASKQLLNTTKLAEGETRS